MMHKVLFVGGPYHGRQECRNDAELHGFDLSVKVLAAPAEPGALVEGLPVKVGHYRRLFPTTAEAGTSARVALSMLWEQHRETGHVTLFWVGWDQP